ncbi:hypothetical protein [Desulfovibrio sp. DV]|uniref:hypothetical protein n=1 Tax=Desulfovibrio sp. DV TaxID=1844708 RepID=UPI000ABDC2FF|nr:hypothetical protein [Desulfovibrio sp. DV]
MPEGDKDGKSQTFSSGVIYFLPKAMFRISVSPIAEKGAAAAPQGSGMTQTLTPTGSKKTTAKDAKVAVQTKKKQNTAGATPTPAKTGAAMPGAEGTAGTTGEGAPGGGTAVEPEAVTPATAQAAVQNNTTINVTNSSGQPAAQAANSGSGHDIEFEFRRSDYPKSKFKFTLDVITTVDPTQVYSLQYVPGSASNDDITIAVKDFFISSVNTTTEDQSAAIAKKSVELIKQAILLGTGLPGAAPTGGAAQISPSAKPEAFDVEIDPIDILNFVNKGTGIEGTSNVPNPCHMFPDEIQINVNALIPPGAISSADKTGGDGVRYRAAFPYRVLVTATAGIAVARRIERIVLLPNESPAYLFDLRRTAFVKKTYAVQFENGFLTSAKINKPSELLAGVSLPVDIIKSIASIPAEIIQLKINYNSQQQALLEAEKTKFESLKAFNDAVLEMYKTNANQTQTLIEQLKK